MLKKLLLLLLCGTFMISAGLASHMMGGEITWQCQANGSFKFTMKIYRDCNGVPFFPNGNSLTVFNHPTVTSIPLFHVLTTDISPQGPDCFPCGAPGANLGETEEYIMESNDVFLSGVPPAQGWVFAWSLCCRNPVDNLVNSGSQNYTTRAIMYPYGGQNTNPCFDSSPYFAERPNVIMCTRNPFTYNHNGVDPDLDSLVFDWAQPLGSLGAGWPPGSVLFQSGYSFNSPLPSPTSTPFNPGNVGATMNTQTGEVNFTSYTSGNFVTVSKVTAYKCGIKVAEIFRDIQVVLIGGCIISSDSSALAFNVDISPIPVTCAGAANGSASVTPSGGSAPYTFMWSNGSTLSSATGLSGGNHHVTVTDASGCSITLVFNINEPAPLILRTNSKPAKCGLADGTASVVVTGGVTPYTYSWNNGDNTSTINDLPAGNYTVTVTDKKGCTATASVAVSALTAPVLTLVNSSDVSCFGASDGAVTVSSSGGTNPITYLWSNGNNSASVTGLAGGIHTVTVTDAAGCIDSLNVNIAEPTAITVNMSSNPSTCSNNNGSASVTAGGGTPPYSYSWSNGPTTPSYNNIGAGAYTVAVSDANGCSVVQTVSVNDTGAPTISLSSSTVVSCAGAADGSASVSVSGGTGPYTYVWSSSSSTSNTANGLSGGDHSVMVTDATGCSASLIVSLYEPAPLNLNMSSVSSECGLPNGSATVVVSGGSGSYIYSWSNSSISGSINNLAANNYTVTVTDANGCSTTGSVSVTNLSTPNIVVNSSTPVSCAGAADGAISVTASGGTPPLAYLWNNGSGSPSLTGLSGGNYTITVTDAAGCTASQTITITQPPALNVNANGTATYCGTSNGSASVSASGGTSPYSYLWSNTSVAPSLSNLIAGAYTVTVTDATGCTATQTVAVNNTTQFGYNTAPQLGSPGGPFQDPVTGLYTKFDTTVCVGDTISFVLNVFDFENLPNGMGQSVTITATGQQLGISPSVGCLNPPCATISPQPPVTNVYGVTVNFNWVTDCSHLTGTSYCGTTTNTYTFVIRAQDNFCPAPAMNFYTIVIRVKAEAVPPASFRCIAVQPNGNALLNWLPTQAAGLTKCEMGSFHSYDIYSSTFPGGPYQFVDSLVGNPNLTSYLDVNANANNQSKYYFILTRWGCDIFTPNPNVSISDTLRSIFLTVGNTNPEIASLSWNPLITPALPTTSSWYRIYKKKGVAGTWSLIDSTQTLTYSDSAKVCSDSVFYRIEIADASGCVSVSNEAGNTFLSLNISIDRPSLRCVAVNDPTGDIILTWAAPTDTADYFSKYEIWHSPSGAPGSFTMLQSINTFNTTTYTHSGANGNIQSQYYFLRVEAGCDPTNLSLSPASDTLRSIYLNVGNTNPQIANLTWNAIHTPNLVTSTGNYLVYRKTGVAGSWNLIGNTTALVYNDSTKVCADSIFYRVEIEDSLGCFSVSNVKGNWFETQTVNVSPPLLRCVAVNQPSGSITITWSPAVDTAQYFDSYEIYHSTNLAGPYTLLQTISGYTSNTYTHATATGNVEINYYYIKTVAGCDSVTLVSSVASDILASMYLTVSPIPGFASLTWNAIHVPLLSTTQLPYNIFRDNGTGWVQIGTSNTTNYVDTITACNVQISYRVEIADQIGCTSVSNVATGIFSFQPPLIDSPSLRCVAVQTNGDVTLTWTIPPDPDSWFNKYEIFHSTGGPFSLLDSVTIYAQTSFTHAGANGNNQINSYYIVSYSGCPYAGMASLSPSATLNSMLLTATPTMGFANLSWNALGTPLPGTSTGTYKIFRDNGSGWVQIGTTTSLTYSDPITDCNIPIDYRVDIDDASGCTSVSSVASGIFTYLGDVIDNPSLRCVTVQNNGDVVLNWIIPPDPTNFYSEYEIYHSNGAGFSRLTSVNNYTQDSYTHTGANGQNQVNSYYLVSLSGCSGIEFSGASDTLSSILLSANPSLGFANLTWNPMHSPNPFIPTSSGIYEVWRNFDNQGWTQIGSTNSEAYTDTISDCNVPIAYRVEISDASGCKSVSSVDNDIFTYLGVIVDAPSVRCVSVEPNGDIILNWIAPPDPENFFNDYQLYHSNSAAGPFSLITTLNIYTQSGYTHVGANGQNVANYYHVITRSGCTGIEESIPSDTLAAMLLGVNNLSGIAQLNWIPLHDPNLPTSSGIYNVYKEYPLGSWTFLGTTTQTTYLDTITLCYADINYRVEMDDASGCTSVSSVDGDLFQDLTPPSVPVIDSVSVDPLTGIVSVGWNVNPSGDTQGYIIYLFNGASYDSIASVSGINNTGFVNAASNAQTFIETYAIAAFDSCGNLSPYSAPHNTILSDSYLDICTASNILSWNAYQNMNSGLQEYAIFASIDGGPFNKVGSVDGSTHTYSHSGLVPDVTYCYYIQAINGDGTITSSSTLTCEFSRLLIDPTFGYLKVATVAGENQVLIQAYIDTLADVSGYRIERSRSVNGTYSSVGMVAPPVNSDILTFTDGSASTGTSSYYYRVVVVDSCGNDKFISNIGRTIYLEATADDFFRNHLVWNDYEEWNGEVESYNIYRVIDGFWEAAPLANVPFGINTYTDDITKFYESHAKFCYLIEAIQGIDTIYAFTDTSLSNEACAIQPIKVYTPNAFTPGGANPVFKPVQIFIDVNSYTFNVFNRWGEKIYETHNPDAGWDGSYDGDKAPQGVYIYKVEFKGVNGKEFLKRGTFTLLR
jgi:gliding motility-associated-like protein